MTTPVVLKLYGLDSSEETKELSSWVGVFFLGKKLKPRLLESWHAGESIRTTQLSDPA